MGFHTESMVTLGVFEDHCTASVSTLRYPTYDRAKTKLSNSRIGKHLASKRPKQVATSRPDATLEQQDRLKRLRRPYIDVLSAPINIPPEYAALQYSNKAYFSTQDISPVDSVISQDNDYHRVSHYTWQDQCTTPTTHLRQRSRHIEIVIPEWTRPGITVPNYPESRPKSATKTLRHLSDFPTPPSEQASPPVRARSRQFKGPRRQTRKLASILDSTYYINKPLPPIRELVPRVLPKAVPRSKAGQDTKTMADAVMSPAMATQTAGLASVQGAPTNSLSSLVCNVHRTTGDVPPALVGASTVVSGDKLFVFGGRRLSRRRPQLTQNLYELDLVKRHWTLLRTTGTKPAPRYFHSVCALGDTKLVCYGGMAPIARTTDAPQEASQNSEAPPAEPEIVVMSDIHIYDIVNRSWMLISTSSSPAGRYAHCAAILPSWSVFTSESAPLSALRSSVSPSSSAGQNLSIDGRGGAEMVIVGGQDGSSRYIEEISIFNLRSLSWTTTTELGRSCGAYRSVVAPLTNMRPSQIGISLSSSSIASTDSDTEPSAEEGHATLIYSNYNFLDVKLELQIRHPDGRMFEKPMTGVHSPPGLRFPNGEIISNHFVVSGTFLTSTRQEYALWALNLQTLTWSRIDVGPGILTAGSWNRGILWRKHNTYVVLGDRRRNLAEDYNHRRLNFTNMCTVELEPFGLYENPVSTPPTIGFDSASSPLEKTFVDMPIFDRPFQSETGQALGRVASELREIADMDFLAIGGERISVNFHIIARRWGPYLAKMLDGMALPGPPQSNGARSILDSETSTIKAHHESMMSTNSVNTVVYPSRTSSIAATPNPYASFSNTVSSALDNIAAARPSVISTASGATGLTLGSTSSSSTVKPTDPEYASALTAAAAARPRLLYFPHTYLTIRALVHYLYTWTLPPPNTPLCTPQVLCSLLQIARPYRVNGLLEAVVQRLHQGFEGRSTAAVFNAAAMAAGGMQGVAFVGDRRDMLAAAASASSGDPTSNPSASPAAQSLAGASAARQAQRDAGMNAATDVTDSEDGGAGTLRARNASGDESDGGSSASGSDMSSSVTSLSSAGGRSDAGTSREPAIWSGSLSSVVGLQKRGLRGLMEGRALRERLHGATANAKGGAGPGGAENGQGQGQVQSPAQALSDGSSMGTRPPTAEGGASGTDLGASGAGDNARAPANGPAATASSGANGSGLGLNV